MLERGQKVAINYAGWLEDGTEFVNTWLVPDSVTITIGASELLPAIEDGQVLFDTNHELAGHDLSFEVELVDDGTTTALEAEGSSTGCGCNRLRESLGKCDCDHEHAHH